jgi:hypothetical protein
MSEHVLVKDNGAGMYYICITTIIILVFMIVLFSCLGPINSIYS